MEFLSPGSTTPVRTEVTILECSEETLNIIYTMHLECRMDIHLLSTQLLSDGDNIYLTYVTMRRSRGLHTSEATVRIRSFCRDTTDSGIAVYPEAVVHLDNCVRTKIPLLLGPLGLNAISAPAGGALEAHHVGHSFTPDPDRWRYLSVAELGARYGIVNHHGDSEYLLVSATFGDPRMAGHHRLARPNLLGGAFGPIGSLHKAVYEYRYPRNQELVSRARRHWCWLTFDEVSGTLLQFSAFEDSSTAASVRVFDVATAARILPQSV